MTAKQLPSPLQLTLPAEPSSIPAARHAVEGYARSLGDADLLAVGVSTSEVVTNAVRHAYEDHARGSIDVQADVLVPSTLRVTITDDGDGMRPRLGSAGAGLGLPLVGELCEDLEITPNGPHGTRVVMQFGSAAEGQAR